LEALLHDQILLRLVLYHQLIATLIVKTALAQYCFCHLNCLVKMVFKQLDILELRTNLNSKLLQPFHLFKDLAGFSL
jgi:hypothetical protein